VLRLWNSKFVRFVRAAVEVYGIVKTLAALGASAVLGVLVPAVLELLVNLSYFEKAILGLGMFFITLAGILALLKPALERRASRKSELEEERQRHAAEIEDLKARLHGAERERNLLLSQVQELRTMSPEEYRTRQEQRRKRIERWRTTIRGFDFTSDFALTETYSEMTQYLRPDVRDRFESSFGVLQKMATTAFVPRERGPSGDRRTLLDEVARIEKEWGLV
jgi:hypothetical protein